MDGSFLALFLHWQIGLSIFVSGVFSCSYLGKRKEVLVPGVHWVNFLRLYLITFKIEWSMMFVCPIEFSLFWFDVSLESLCILICITRVRRSIDFSCQASTMLRVPLIRTYLASASNYSSIWSFWERILRCWVGFEISRAAMIHLLASVWGQVSL